MATLAPIRDLLWDVDESSLDLRKHRRFIIARVLKFGTSKEIRWLLAIYAEAEIIETVKTSRSLDRRTANFWALHYGIPVEDIRCLQTPWPQDCFY